MEGLLVNGMFFCFCFVFFCIYEAINYLTEEFLRDDVSVNFGVYNLYQALKLIREEQAKPDWFRRLSPPTACYLLLHSTDFCVCLKHFVTY